MKSVASRGDGRVCGKGVTVHARGFYTLRGDVKLGAVEAELEVEALVGKLKASLQHDSLTRILGVCKVAPSSYKLLSVSTSSNLAMKLDTLYSLGKSVPFPDAKRWFDQAISALSHLHLHQVVVGTLTPHNFILDAAGNVKVHDYAYASLSKERIIDPCIGTEVINGSSNTCTSGLLHTYLPPEVAAAHTHSRVMRDRGHLWGFGGEASDAWSCGLTFLELIVAPHCPWYRSGAELLYQKAFTTAELGTAAKGADGTSATSPRHQADEARHFESVAAFRGFLLQSIAEPEPQQEAWTPPAEIAIDLSAPVHAPTGGKPKVFTAALERVDRRGQEVGEDNKHAMRLLVKRACKMLEQAPSRRWVPSVVHRRVQAQPAARSAGPALRCGEVGGLMESLRDPMRVASVVLPTAVPVELQQEALRTATHSTLSKRDAEAVVLATFLNSDTDMGQVIGSLETVRQNFLNTKSEALVKGSQKIMTAACAEKGGLPPDAGRKRVASSIQGPGGGASGRRQSHMSGRTGTGEAAAAVPPSVVNETFSMYCKKVKSGEESVLSLLRDKGMFAAQPKCTVPLLFRTPSVCGIRDGDEIMLVSERNEYIKKCDILTFPTPRWRKSACVDIPCSWFVSATHTRAPVPLDAIEGVAGHSNYSTKMREHEGHKKQKTCLRTTLLSHPGAPLLPPSPSSADEVARTQKLRLMLLQYPASRVDIIDTCLKQGVPPALRGEVWCAALGVPALALQHDTHSKIDVSITSKDDDQIAKDVPRCHQYDPWLGSDEGKHKLGRVLKKWVVSQGPVGTSRYIQGMASLAAPFVTLLFADEPLALAGYSALLARYPYLSCDPGSGYALLRGSFYSLLAFHDAPLWAKVQELDIPEDVFLSRLRTHFAHDVPLQKIYPIWDAVFFGNKNLIFAIAIALLMLRRTDLLQEKEVTEATQLWKNSMLEVHVLTYIEKAKHLLQRTPAGLTGPPSYVDQDLHLMYKRGSHNAPMLPVAYLPRSDMVKILMKRGLRKAEPRAQQTSNSPTAKDREEPADDRFVIISTAWAPRDAGLCDLRVPLHASPTAGLLDRLEAALASFGVTKGPATTGLRIAITGATTLNVSWGPPPTTYQGAHDLARELCSRGYSGVAVCPGHPDNEQHGQQADSPPPSRPVPLWASPSRSERLSASGSRVLRTCYNVPPLCVAEHGPLPASLPEAVWCHALSFLPAAEHFGVAAVCRGLHAAKAAHERSARQTDERPAGGGGDADAAF